MELIIEKKKIKEWLVVLGKDFKVVDTRKKVLPPKQYFFPVKEDLFSFDLKSKKLKTIDQSENILLLISSLNKLEAMTQLDEIMEKPQKDFFYWQKRDKSVLVGIVDESIKVPYGGDLVLEKINQKEYRTWVLNSKGRNLLKDKFFKKVLKPRTINYPSKPNIFKEKLLDSELLAEAVEWSWQSNHKIWNELAEKCLGCGICTYVCPLCHCFSMEDQVSLDNSKCFRCRQWDACTLPRFSQIAGGHNFHKTIKERYYNWYYHKFVRAYRQYGKAQCVACGACKDNCPAGIKIGEVLKEIVKDYKKR
ncbi:4Fe-4S dicluster domain-containing protein [Patescibacteria group bacterium]|nr:4Fe-4S dicluster domain-containing protein [Patescibacteria group bacterium]MBU2068590.1 4Fe-4S dicluster domain-containing protein [Patescibacteria group bacterium]